ncbi:MAG: class I SAM-dependent methyltransferase [Pseudomonadales bacterium]
MELGAFNRSFSMQHWLETDLGQTLVESEQKLLNDRLQACFGYRLLQLSFGDVSLYGCSRIGHCFSLAPSQLAGSHGAVAHYEALPLEQDSIDVVILHHVLEFSDNPHQVLREARRILVPNGKMFIFVLNPWSLFSLRCLASRLAGNKFWHRQYLSNRKLQDWLSLLELKPHSLNYGFHHFPVNSSRFLQKSHRFGQYAQRISMPFGGVYMIEATKEVNPLTPVRSRWQGWSRGFQGLGVAQPTMPVSNRVH